jgi:hypothetical protein
MVFRIAVTVFSLFLIAFGLVWTISPLPFGFVIVFFGFLLLASVAPAEVRWVRRRWRWFDRVMHRLEDRLPGWIAKRLRISDYDHDEDELLPKKRKPSKKGARA